MKLGNLEFKQEAVFGALTALSLVLAPVAISQTTSTTYVAEKVSIVGACGKLFDIDSNADGMTARERAAIIQKNLDYAVIHAANRTPSAVKVAVVNRNPVVIVDKFHIATADGNSAARAGMPAMQLAQKWADSIRFCLADAAAMDKYLSMLTGNYKKAAVITKQEVAYLPAGKFLPVKLVTPIDSVTAALGDPVQAVLTTDIPLRTSQSATQMDAYIPAGTSALGHLVDEASPYYGKRALGIRFTELRTPDGSVIPVIGHVFGGEGSWSYWNTEPNVVEAAPVAVGQTGLVAAKGTICGGWRGAEIEAGLGVPYQKLVITRKVGLVIPSGERFMMQMSAPAAIALSGPSSTTSIAVSGTNAL